MIRADRIASGLDNPVFAASPPGDPNRLFIAEKNSGRILSFDLSSNTLDTHAVFDVPAEEMSNVGSQGLLGFAFHPDYEANGKLYLSLSNEDQDSEIWEVTGNTWREVLTIDRTNPVHNAGWIGFGPDGHLYIPTGDSGGFSLMDPENAAQNLADLRGKLLRIDVDGDDFPGDATRNYAIPTDNPFGDEIFAYGLRNPWRASFDRETGDLYIGNVGEFHREEIEYLPAGTGAGTNFGWRVMEGTRPTGYPQDGNPPPNDPVFRPPLLEYAHGTGDFQGFSVTGGYVHRGQDSEHGQYFFADFVSDHLWTARVQNGALVDWRQRDADLQVNGGTFDQIVSFAEDGQGRLYAIGLDGELFLFAMDAEAPPPAATADDDGGDFGEVAVFIGAAAAIAAWLL